MLSEKIIERAMSVDPAQIGHYIESGYMHPRIKPVSDSFKVLGPAFTIRIPVNDSAMIYYAMKKAPKGSVIVVDRMGEHRFACCGEIVVTAAKSLGMAGIVIDGPSTDTLAIKEVGLPVFSTGRSAVTTTLIGLTGEYNIPVTCGGAVVNPGDIIFGDIDGVIVSPPDIFEDLVCKAEKANAMEVGLKKRLAEGGYVTDFIDIDNLVETDSQAMLQALLAKK